MRQEGLALCVPCHLAPCLFFLLVWVWFEIFGRLEGFGRHAHIWDCRQELDRFLHETHTLFTFALPLATLHPWTRQRRHMQRHFGFGRALQHETFLLKPYPSSLPPPHYLPSLSHTHLPHTSPLSPPSLPVLPATCHLCWRMDLPAGICLACMHTRTPLPHMCFAHTPALSHTCSSHVGSWLAGWLPCAALRQKTPKSCVYLHGMAAWPVSHPKHGMAAGSFTHKTGTTS